MCVCLRDACVRCVLKHLPRHLQTGPTPKRTSHNAHTHTHTHTTHTHLGLSRSSDSSERDEGGGAGSIRRWAIGDSASLRGAVDEDDGCGWNAAAAAAWADEEVDEEVDEEGGGGCGNDRSVRLARPAPLLVDGTLSMLLLLLLLSVQVCLCCPLPTHVLEGMAFTKGAFSKR